ncbi:MAG: hypothetical protein ACOC9H_00035 [Gemmatimonadota bacterium]
MGGQAWRSGSGEDPSGRRARRGRSVLELLRKGCAELRVRCTYENSTDEVVYGDYGSHDEMCFNFSYIALPVAEQGTDGAGN